MCCFQKLPMRSCFYGRTVSERMRNQSGLKVNIELQLQSVRPPAGAVYIPVNGTFVWAICLCQKLPRTDEEKVAKIQQSNSILKGKLQPPFKFSSKISLNNLHISPWFKIHFINILFYFNAFYSDVAAQCEASSNACCHPTEETIVSRYHPIVMDKSAAHLHAGAKIKQSNLDNVRNSCQRQYAVITTYCIYWNVSVDNRG